MNKLTIYLFLILILSFTALAVECTDSDGEKIGNPTIKTETYPIKRIFLHESVFIKGTTTGEIITHETETWTDECVDSNTLKEYWCDINIPYARSENVECPIGCSNGICIKPSCSQMKGDVCGTNEKCMVENQFVTTDGLCCPYQCESTIKEPVSQGWCTPDSYATQSTVTVCNNNKQTFTNKDSSGNFLGTEEFYCEVFKTTCPTVSNYQLKLQFAPKVIYAECPAFRDIWVNERINYDTIDEANDRVYFNEEMLKVKTTTKGEGPNRILLEGNANTGRIYGVSIKSGEKICLYEPKEMEETPSQTIQVASNTIYSYLENLNSGYRVIVEDSAPGSDSLAATDIITGIQKATQNKIILQSKLASESTQITNLILIGNPCNNNLIPIECESWSYKKGEALIQLSGTNLIVSGTEPDDTRRAAKILANYKDYPLLKQNNKIIVKGATLELSQLVLQEQKPQTQMTCGDDICESGEICDKDCKKLNCLQACQQQNYIAGECKELTNINEPLCKSNEKSLGLKYCTNNQFCCCTSQETSEDQQPKQQEQQVQKQGFFKRVFNWFKRLF